VCVPGCGCFAGGMESSGDEPVPGSAASTAGAFLPVVVQGAKCCECKMCRAKSSDISPLVDARKTDRWGGWHPWAHYIKVSTEDGGGAHRQPNGKVCLLCINVFNALGPDLRFAAQGEGGSCGRGVGMMLVGVSLGGISSAAVLAEAASTWLARVLY